MPFNNVRTWFYACSNRAHGMSEVFLTMTLAGNKAEDHHHYHDKLETVEIASKIPKNENAQNFSSDEALEKSCYDKILGKVMYQRWLLRD